MKNIFLIKRNARVTPNDILVKVQKSATFEDKNLTILGPNPILGGFFRGSFWGGVGDYLLELC